MSVRITDGPGAASKIFRVLKNGIRKNSPELLVIGGTVAFVGTLISMYKTSTKVKEAVDEANEEISLINEMTSIHSADGNGLIEYTEEDKKEDIKAVKRASAKKIIKATAPTALLAAVTLSSFLGADYIRRQRHAALFAASEMMLHSYDSYRKGVIDKYGPEVDRELKYKLFTEEKEVEETNPETGRKKKTKKQILNSHYDGHSDFARRFDETNDLYQRNMNVNGKEPSYGVYNLALLTQLEKDANDALRRNGFFTINEAYEMLHFEKTKAGRDAGWIFDPKDPTCRNDTHISFGLMHGKSEDDLRAILLGEDGVILLDFNIDTLNVWDGMDDTPIRGLLPGRSH